MAGDYDMVNNPSHYVEGRKYETFDVIRDWDLGYCLGNAVKYISRAGRKVNSTMDIEKSMWYLQRYLDERSDTANKSTESIDSGSLDNKYSSIRKGLIEKLIQYLDKSLSVEQSIISKILEMNPNISEEWVNQSRRDLMDKDVKPNVYVCPERSKDGKRCKLIDRHTEPHLSDDGYIWR